MNHFSTKDLYVAGLIYAKGIQFLGVEREGVVCWFLFGDEEKASTEQEAYFGRKALVNAKDYAEAIKTLKHLVFS